MATENNISQDREEKEYEIGYLLSPLVPAEETGAVLDKTIRKAIEMGGGKILGENAPVMTKLAYTVGKTVEHKRTAFKDAYFGAVRFTVYPEKAVSLKEEVEKMPEIIRFLILKSPAVKNNSKVGIKPAGRIVKPTSIAKEGEPKAEMSQEEIDKEIENLLTPENSNNK